MHLATDYLGQAHRTYNEYGAKGKVRHLQNTYKEITPELGFLGMADGQSRSSLVMQPNLDTEEWKKELRHLQVQNN